MRNNYLKLTKLIKIFLIAMILIIPLFLSYIPTSASNVVVDLSEYHKLGIRFISFTDLVPNIITFGYDGKIIKWDLSKIFKINSIKLLKTDITSLSITEDKKIICLGFSDGYISFIDIQDYEVLKTFHLKNDKTVTSISLSTDKKYFVVINSDNSMNIYSYKNGRLLKNIYDKNFTGYIPKTNMKSRTIAFYKANEIIIYSLHKYKILKKIHLEKSEIIFDVKFSPNGEYLYVCGEKGKIYEIKMNLRYSMEVMLELDRNNWIHTISVDKYGNLVFIDDNNSIYYYNSTRKEKYKIHTAKKDIINVDIELYGRYFAYTDLFGMNILPIEKWARDSE